MAQSMRPQTSLRVTFLASRKVASKDSRVGRGSPPWATLGLAECSFAYFSYKHVL